MGELEFAAVAAAATKPSVQETIKSGQIEENPAAKRNEREMWHWFNSFCTAAAVMLSRSQIKTQINIWQ
jgi:hypothetical protein